ncbi:hypothetical protein K488DRAFT_85189 [Vararia minispora EC-137]|uniref:Uncharacterized protein n=1 Tax=Vararia minispora EC-137 TaxID=1314806 RepID=A0ACB8QN56_9AGAM|nr:hypothetical protein K488DRAFT_85189 [Vararia minispora EC-137]
MDYAVRGFVDVLASDDIRWHITLLQTFGGGVGGTNGRPVWSCEGVAVGGAGVLGCWTTAEHDEDDPVGPFWLNKLRDDEDDVVLLTDDDDLEDELD